MGGSRDCCIGTRHSAIERFCMESEPYKICVKDGQPEKAMQLFEQMQREGVRPNKFTFVQVIKACAGLVRLEDGRLVHEQLIQSGCESNVFLENSMVDMYAKCGSIEDACRVFNKMPARDVVSWTVIILGHLKCGFRVETRH